MKCLICGESLFTCIHYGTRDIQDINVMKCIKCGMVQLDKKVYNTEQGYVSGNMLKNSYGITTDKTEDKEWNTWVQETKNDDDRRYEKLKELCIGKSILEFGCGNGGFLRRIKKRATVVTGIELMEKARQNIEKEGITIYKSLQSIHMQYDIVCMFMVIEHLNDPDTILGKIYDILKPGGILICETPNAEDVLLSKYQCKSFEDFTYWSEHVFLYNSENLEKLFNRNKLRTKCNTQIQRYSLSNHLYWLSKGKPGGHMKWKEFNEQKLNEIYAEKLIEQKIADTLWYVGEK